MSKKTTKEVRADVSAAAVPSVRDRLALVEKQLRLTAASLQVIVDRGARYTMDGTSMSASDLAAPALEQSNGALEQLYWLQQHVPDVALEALAPNDDDAQDLGLDVHVDGGVQ